MFKTLYTNSLVLLFFLTTILFLSCDGKASTFENHVESFKEKNTYKPKVNAIKWIPENYIEIKTDTILSNGFQIKLIYNSVDEDSILKTDNTNSNQVYYKNFEAKLYVSKNGVLVNQYRINKNLFQSFENQSYWKKAIMQSIWIDYEASTAISLVFNTAFYNLDTKMYKDYILKIDASGGLQIKEKSYSPNII